MSALESLFENTKSAAIAARQELQHASAEWEKHSASLATALDLQDAEMRSSRERLDLEMAKKLGAECDAEMDAARLSRKKQEAEDATLAAKLDKLDVFEVPHHSKDESTPVGGSTADDSGSESSGASDSCECVVHVNKAPMTRQLGVVLEEKGGTIFSSRRRRRVIIGDLVANSPAAEQLKTYVGNTLLSVNGQSFTTANEAAKLISDSPDRVSLRFNTASC